MKRNLNLKKHGYAILSLALCAALIIGLAGCGLFGVRAESQGDFVAPAPFSPKASDTNADWDETATMISLNGTGAKVSGSGASASGGIVTVTGEGTYVLEGSLENGQILVLAGKGSEVRLVLNGVDITNKTGAAIYAEKAGKLIVTLAEGSENRLVDGGSTFAYANAEKEEPDAALFAKNDLTVNGTGSLTVLAGFNNGIGCKDNLLIVSGKLTVSAANNALKGSDSVTILDGTLRLTAGNDGIRTKKADETEEASATPIAILIEGGTFDISATSDAIQSGGTLTISGGNINVNSGGGYPGKSAKSQDSRKGIKAAGDILITGGTFSISSYDDGIHSDGSITIEAGTFVIQSGDDGIHADNTVTVNGGNINVKNSYEGIEGTLVIFNGGETVVHATDDGVNASANVSGLTPTVTINGGKLTVYAQSDGIDANGNIVIIGGTTAVFINAPRDGDPIDIDRNASILPTIFGIGVSIAPGTKMEIEGVWSGIAENAATSFCLCVPGLVNGQSYSVKANGSVISSLTATATVVAARGGGGMGGGSNGGFGGGNPGGSPGGTTKGGNNRGR